MTRIARTILVAALVVAAAAPCAAGIHYKAVTKTEGAGQAGEVQVEGWVSGDDAKVTFRESSGNPVLEQGTYLITKDGGKTLYLVDPDEKTYAEWSLDAMLGAVGAIMRGMGPLLKIQFTEPEVRKIMEEDGGVVAGLPTRHVKLLTRYTVTVRVLGMGNATEVVSEQDVWATTRLQDVGLGVWLRADPPRTGNPELDKLIAAESHKFEGFPLRTVTVSTSTAKKSGKATTTRSTMEVTELDAGAAVPASTFEIPAGYERTEVLPMEPR